MTARKARFGIRAGIGVASLALLVLLAGGGMAPGALPSAAEPTGPGPLTRVVEVAPGYHPPTGAVELGPLPSSTKLTAMIGLAPRDPSGLAARVALEETPGNPLYRQFLPASALAAEYGASPATLSEGTAELARSGIVATATPDHLFLELRGSAGEFDRTFSTTLDQYRVDGSLVFAHATPAFLPAGPPWTGVLGLGNTSEVRPAIGPLVHLPASPAASGCPANETDFGFTPCQIDRAYNVTPLLDAGTNGTGYRIAVVDAYDSFEPQGQLSKDFRSFASNYSLPATAPQFVYPVPTSVDLNASASSGWGDEEALDLEWARASAPGATVEMVLSPNPSVGLYESVDWLVAHQAADVISLSWSEPDVGVYNAFSTPCSYQCNATTDGSYTLLHPVLEEAAAEGIGVFAATGDCGAAAGTSGVSTGYPASDPYVTGVGGSVLQVDSNGDWSSEAAWSGNDSGAISPGCVNQGGSGGGYAPYPRPAWQAGPGIPTNQTERGEPDVAFNAGQAVGIYLDGSHDAVGGTSAGSPMWAGFELLADQLHGGDLGSLDPSLYALARGSNASSLFHDITIGTNGYDTGPGWDPVTGLGTPIEDALAPAVSSAPPPPVGTTFATLTASPRSGPAPLTAQFNLIDSRGGLPAPAFVDVSFGDGNATLLPESNPEANLGFDVVAHTYPRPGVYAATATYVDASGNSSTSPPVVLVVGGGQSLNVSLGVSNATPVVGGSVTLTASVTDGTAPYLYSFFFGDGTYRLNTSAASVVHRYDALGSLCAEVVAVDAASPSDGGSSLPRSVSVGGEGTQACLTTAPLIANLSSARTAGDLPGDFPLAVTVTGGVLPYSTQLVSDDPYVAACECAIFRTVGTHTITAFVNDSFSKGVVRTINVTTYPALVVTPSSSNLSGSAPLRSDFDLAWSGGHFTRAANVTWSFGDGSANLSGSTPFENHTFALPGVYDVEAVVADQGGGHAWAAWVVDVESPNASGLVVTATLAPSATSTFGGLYEFTANATGGTAPYRYRWGLGQDDSAFGATVQQSYARTGCLGLGTCPLAVHLSVNDSANGTWATPIDLTAPFYGNSSGATVLDSGEVAPGVTPYPVSGTVAASGVRGLVVNWSFGDGGSAEGASASHSYYDPGNYTILETVTDPFGDRLLRSHAVVVTGARILPLIATASANLTVGLAPMAVTFSFNATGGLGAPYTANWSFGDGFFETGVTGPVSHVYLAPGNRTAAVTVRDVRGDTATSAVDLTIYAVTYVDLNLTVSPDPAVYGDPVQYDVHAVALCTVHSVPGCSDHSTSLDLYLAYSNESLDGATPIAGARAVSHDWSNGSLPDLRNYTGPVYLWALAEGPNYSGAAFTLTEVEGLCMGCPGSPHGNAEGPWLFAGLLAVATGAAAALALAVIYGPGRRRVGPAPPEPPEFRDGPG